MPAVTRKRASSHVPAAEDVDEAPGAEMDVEEHGAQNGLPQLRFKEPLSWRAGKAIPVAELLRRLETFAKELRDLDQEEVERDSLLTSAKELASQQLLAHKDRGVKAWTASCLVDILRLCAPDAPYTGKELKASRLESALIFVHAKRNLGNLLSLHLHHLPCAYRSF